MREPPIGVSTCGNVDINDLEYLAWNDLCRVVQHPVACPTGANLEHGVRRREMGSGVAPGLRCVSGHFRSVGVSSGRVGGSTSWLSWWWIALVKGSRRGLGYDGVSVLRALMRVHVELASLWAVRRGWA